MAGVIINIQATDSEGNIDAHDLANYIAEIVKSAIGENVRVNVSTMDMPSNPIDTYKTMRSATNKPWLRHGN